MSYIAKKSRIAKNPVVLPAGVKAEVSAGQIEVSGPIGKLTHFLVQDVKVAVNDGQITFEALNDSRHASAMSGTLRALVNNMVIGVSKNFQKKLLLVGVGYKAQAQGDVLNLSLGFSHPVTHKMPVGVSVKTPTPTEIIIEGSSKQQVGQVAAEVRAYRPPEPYKGKGVRYSDEVVVIKETKKK